MLRGIVGAVAGSDSCRCLYLLPDRMHAVLRVAIDAAVLADMHDMKIPDQAEADLGRADPRRSVEADFVDGLAAGSVDCHKRARSAGASMDVRCCREKWRNGGEVQE